MFVIPIIFSMFMISVKVHTYVSNEEEGIVHVCVKKTEVTYAEIKHLEKDNMTLRMLCFMKCKYEMRGFVDEKGQLIKKVIQDRYDDLQLKEEVRKTVNKCIDQSKPVEKCTDLINRYFHGLIVFQQRNM